MDFSELLKEVKYKAVRSSGSGGQNVNKVATKVQLYWDVVNSEFFEDEDKEKIQLYFSNRINSKGVLILSCDETRSQLRNKTTVTERFIEELKESLIEEKERIPTKIPKAVKQKRLKNKRRNSEKKANRKPPSID